MQHATYVGIGSLALGIGAAAVSLLGPIGFDVIQWRIAESTENQIIGQDLVTLLLVAPLAIAAGFLWLRRHSLAPLLTLGPALYSLYTFLSYILAPDYHRYAGNNEAAFPLLLALVIVSWLLAVAAWRAIDADLRPAISPRVRKGLGASFMLVGGLFILAWSAQVAEVIGGSTTLTEYQDDPGTFWVIKTFDLAFVMPIAIATGIGLLKNHPFAGRTSYAVASFFALMSAAVSAMGITMLINDDPAATLVLPLVTTPMTFVLAGLAIALMRTPRQASVEHLTIGQPSATGNNAHQLATTNAHTSQAGGNR